MVNCSRNPLRNYIHLIGSDTVTLKYTLAPSTWNPHQVGRLLEVVDEIATYEIAFKYRPCDVVTGSTGDGWVPPKPNIDVVYTNPGDRGLDIVGVGEIDFLNHRPKERQSFKCIRKLGEVNASAEDISLPEQPDFHASVRRR